MEERPAHEVKVGSFELDKFEVTVADYRVCVKHGACPEPAKASQCNFPLDDRLDHPMNCVTLEEAEAFCRWVDKRLPTEVEFEYAAGGGGRKRLFPWGDKLPENKELNACGTECRHSAELSSRALRHIIEVDDGFPTTAPVGSFEAGETLDGVQDLAGNVWEWTSSHVCAYPEHSCASGELRIIRGGSWINRYLLTFEVTTREPLARGERSEAVGFRCARDAS
jgi:formylglycine-generating enzyme required for sulfatase activity